MRTVKQYAFAIGDKRVGPWRPNRAAAALDALRHGCAERDRFDERIVYLSVPADIVTRMVEPPMPESAGSTGRLARRPTLRLVT